MTSVVIRVLHNESRFFQKITGYTVLKQIKKFEKVKMMRHVKISFLYFMLIHHLNNVLNGVLIRECDDLKSKPHSYMICFSVGKAF